MDLLISIYIYIYIYICILAIIVSVDLEEMIVNSHQEKKKSDAWGQKYSALMIINVEIAGSSQASKYWIGGLPAHF